MSRATSEPESLLRQTLQSGRIHSAYLLSGPGPEPREAAQRFVRGLVCESAERRPCEACPACERSNPGEEALPLDGTGKSGPLLRHVGGHPDLLWVERGAADTRVRIGQVRALQSALRLRPHGDGRRAAVIADAEWLNHEAQNALLRLLEEPPPRTSLVLVTTSPAGLLATVRSRCQRLSFRAPEVDPLAENQELVSRLDALPRASLPELLDWAEEYRGARAPAAAGVQQLLEGAGAWLSRRIVSEVRAGRSAVRVELDAQRVLADCRKSLVQRNANPQMVAERALLAVRDAVRS